MSEQITHYTPCCATCRHAEAGGPCAWRHDNADGDCCPDWEYGNHAAWLGDDTPYPMASREITAEPHGSMEEHTALCEHTRVESLPDRRKQLPHHVMVLHSQKGLLAAAALAHRYGKELHPAGTAAKLQELAKERDEAEAVRSDRRRLLAENAELRQEAAENAADKKESLKCIRTLSESISRVRRGRIDYDRVRAEVPECEGLSDREINALIARIDFWGSMSTDQRNLISDRSSALTAFDPGIQSYPLTARGREVLATIDACRVTEAEAEPDPDIPYLPTWAISSLLHLLWIDDENLPDAYLHRKVAAELTSKGLIRLTRYEHYALTPTGRALAKRFIANMRRKAPESEIEQTTKTATTPPPTG